MIHFLTLFLIFLLNHVQSASSSNSTADPCTPQQIHISLSDAFTTANSTTNNSIKAIFHTEEECKTAYISLKTTSGKIKITATAVNHFTATYKQGKYSTYVHIFDFPELEFSQQYKYTCYGNDTAQATKKGAYKFYLPNPYYNQSETTKVVIFGDMDKTKYGMTTVNRLKKVAKENFTEISAFIHNGDIAYNLERKGGQRGDSFMNKIQKFTATMPYMVTAGNHETLYNFSNFNMRFQMPNYEESQNHFYSYNIGNIHFTSFNLDLVIDYPKLTEYMLAWLKKDLKEANKNRDKQPWIVAYTHRPLYCSHNDKDCNRNYKRFAKFEKILNKYNVDILIGGHVHVYERMLPIKKRQVANFQHISNDENYNYIINPEAPVYVVQGMAGHRGDPANPKDAYKGRAFTVKIDKAYSFMSVTSNNNTHLLVENYRSDNGTINDYFYIIKSNESEYESVPWNIARYVPDSSAFQVGNSLFVVVILVLVSIFA